MTVYGPPFYDENDWEPDGPSLNDLLKAVGWSGRQLGHDVILSQAQMFVIANAMREQYGRFWKREMQRFIESMTPVFEKAQTVVEEMYPMAECAKSPPPPRHGPQYNPHARRGKGGGKRR